MNYFSAFDFPSDKYISVIYTKKNEKRVRCAHRKHELRIELLICHEFFLKAE